MIETIELTEREYLLQLLAAKHTVLMHELHHASRRDFKERLKRELQTNEELQRKLADL